MAFFFHFLIAVVVWVSDRVYMAYPLVYLFRLHVNRSPTITLPVEFRNDSAKTVIKMPRTLPHADSFRAGAATISALLVCPFVILSWPIAVCALLILVPCILLPPLAVGVGFLSLFPLVPPDFSDHSDSSVCSWFKFVWVFVVVPGVLLQCVNPLGSWWGVAGMRRGLLKVAGEGDGCNSSFFIFAIILKKTKSSYLFCTGYFKKVCF